MASHAELAAAMAAEASAFLASLSSEQRGTAQFPFPSDEERRLWYYTPTDHGGLPLKEMTPPQERAALRLVSSGLSDAGYVTAMTIIGLENVLDRNEGWGNDFNRVRGRDVGLYFLSVFGEPGGAEPWGWRFGGHHVSIQYTILDGRLVASTPSFFGANPANSDFLGPHFLRPLAGVQDTALSLMHTLDPQQMGRAVVSDAAPTDIVTGNRSSIDVGSESIQPLRMAEIWRETIEGELLAAYEKRQEIMETGLDISQEQKDILAFSATPIGLPASDLNSAQRDVLRDLLAQYVGRLPDVIAEAEMAKISGERFDGLHLAWAGSVTDGEPMYYRVQGDRLVVEFDNTQGGANHIHAVWRDPQGDFGLDVLANHYAQSH